MRIFTFGYKGHSPEHLKRCAEEINAKVIDIRFSPLPTYPLNKWSKKQLEITLGDRYEWLKAFGNADYRIDGGMRILDPHGGNARLFELMGERRGDVSFDAPKWDALILMCGCREYMTCHRHIVSHRVEDVFGNAILADPQELIETKVWSETAEQPQATLI